MSDKHPTIEVSQETTPTKANIISSSSSCIDHRQNIKHTSCHLHAENLRGMGSYVDGIEKKKLRELMDRHLELLTDRLDPTFGILNKLLRSGCLSNGECRDIREIETTGAKVEKLMEKILKKEKIEEFIEGLRESNQTHLANYIIGDGVYDETRFGNVWPLRSSETSLLDANQEYLTDNMDSESGLLSKLKAEEVINHRQYEFISDKPNNYRKNETLLDIVRRFSIAGYQKWMKCLVDTNQGHITETLQSGGVVIPIHSDLTDATDGLPSKLDETEEDLIVSKMLDLLANRSNDQSARILEKLQLQLVAVKAKQSICLYFLCKTLQDLRLLNDLLISGRLKSVIETIFGQLLSTADKPRVIRVAPSMSKDTYEKCKKYFDGNVSRRPTEHDMHDIHGIHDIHDIHDMHDMHVHLHSHDDASMNVSEHRQSSKRMKLASELSPRKRDLLRINREILINILDAANLLDGLYKKGVIDAKQREDISALKSEVEKNEVLFSVLEHGSFDSYKNFVKCLRENGKEDVADILQHGGVVARVEATLLLQGTTEQIEMTRIVTDRINGLLRDKKSPDYSLLHELARLKLIAASLTSDVTGAVLYFHLRTLEDLIHLYDLKQCHQLRSFVESVFNNLLPQSETKQRLAPLKWSTEEYERLQQYLLESEKAPPEVERFESRKEYDIISTTHVNSLPFEILDMILRKAYLIPICSKCGRIPDATEKNSFKILASVGSFWFERIRRRRFASRITRCIKAFIQNVSKELVLLRSNWRYLMENLKPKGLASRMRFMGLSKDYGLTDYHLRTTNARKRASAMNDELLSAIRSLALSSTSSCPHSSYRTTFSTSDSVYKTFVESLIHSGQEYAADLVDRGGVVVKVYMVCQRVKHFNTSLNHRKVVEALNELKSKTTKTSKSAWKLLQVLDGYGIDCLNAAEDKGIVFWLRCRHVGALNCLQEIHSSGTLLTLIKDLIRSLTSFHEQWSIFLEAKLSADKDNFLKESVVLRPSVILRSELDTEDRWVSGVTKFDDHIYVMCHSPSVLLVYADQSPFQLVREIQTMTIRKPLDIAASPASNCLYVTDRGSFSDQTETHENSAVWKVAAVKDEVSKWLDGVDNPFTLSVTCDGRVLLLRWVEPPRMEIYGADGQLIRTIRPPSTFEYPRHAVETPRGTWIVCYWVRLDRTWGVCEIGEVDGDLEKAEIVRGFGPVEASEQLNHTYHLAMDSYTRVFVADNSNNRVVLFDPFFRWSEVLLTETRDGVVCPSRVHFDQDKRQLIVVHGGRSFRATPGAWGGRKLDVYDIV